MDITDATDALMLLKRWCYWCADVLLRWCCWCCWCADVLMQLMCWCTGSALVWNVLVSLDLSVHPCFKQQTVSWWFSQDFLWPPINFLQHFLSSTASPTKYSHQTWERISFYSYVICHCQKVEIPMKYVFSVSSCMYTCLLNWSSDQLSWQKENTEGKLGV